MSKKERLRRRLQKLFDDSKGTMEMEVIKTPEQLTQMFLAVCSGNSDAKRTFTLIDGWLKAVNKAKPGTAALCGNCPHEFNSTSLPAVMTIITPFAGTIQQGVVMGICETCYNRVGWDNMQKLALQLWRNVSPNAHAAPSSRRMQ